MMLNKNGISFVIFIIIITSQQYFVLAKEFPEEELLKVVVLSRHGARTPVQDYEFLGKWTEKKLPHWVIKQGYLTPRGSVFVSALWERMYDTLGLKAFFPKHMCPDSDLIYVYSNTMERTQATAVAILNGLAPGCNIPYYVMDNKGFDPLFIPFGSKKFPIAIKDAVHEIKEFYGSIEKVQSELKEPLQEIANVLGPCPEETCRRYNLSQGCSILDISDTIIVDHKHGVLDLSGKLGVAEILTEVFSLGSIQWPGGTLGGMSVSHETLKKIFPIRTKVYAMMKRLPLVAQCNGSGILEAVSTSLTNTNKNEGINKAKLVVFVGHDLNIVTTAGLLSLNWDVGGYPPNEAALGGFLAFSLWRTEKGDVVRIHYVFQSLDSLLDKSLNQQEVVYEPLCLSPLAPPNSKPGTEQVFECSKEEFLCWVKRVINEKYIPTYPIPIKVKYVLD